MGRLARVTQLIFGSTANDIGNFGSAAAGSPVSGANPSVATVMSLSQWLGGWLPAVLGASKFPAIEDMNAVDYAVTSQLAYLFQQGIPEYDAGTAYYNTPTASIVVQPGTYNIFGSLTNANVGNALPTAPASNANWQYLGNLSNLASQLPLPDVQSIAGTNHTVGTADLGLFTKRSNSGTAMVDTLPNGGSAMANGWMAWYQNNDATASLELTTAGTIYMGTQTGNLYIEPGETYQIVSQGSGVYNANRVFPATLHSAPPQSSVKNLVASWSSTTTFNISADAVTVQDANGNTRRITAFNQSVNISTTGAGGLDAGAISANQWYYGYAIYNQETNTKSAIISLSATAPTLPAGYTLASGPLTPIVTDSSSHIIGFKQYGRDWQYTVGNNLSQPPVICSGAQGTIGSAYAAISISGIVPTAVANVAKLLYVSTSGSTYGMAVSPNNSYGNWDTNSPSPFFQNAYDAVGGQTGNFEMLLESTSVYVQSQSGTYLACTGFRVNI